MHFIKRSECPELLSFNKEAWTLPWLNHYLWSRDVGPVCDERPKKPTDNNWLKDEIRLTIIKDFKNNCGYCGDSLPTPQEDEGQVDDREVGDKASKGDVDHFLAKAVYPEKVYEWLNYIWSCKPCNQVKREFDSVDYPLLNPCNEGDCSVLEFTEYSGRYVLVNDVANDKTWKKRMNHSQKNTLINSSEVSKKRRLRVSNLRQRFESIEAHLNNIEQLCNIPNCDAVIRSMEDKVGSQLIEIKLILESPDFYFLIKGLYRELIVKYPKVVVLLN
ncbi:MAG: hypothetical protein RPR97_12750 [Colwellia sp.]|jgi:hypothetical protein